MINNRSLYSVGAVGLIGLGLVWGHVFASAIAGAAAIYIVCDRLVFGDRSTA